MPNLRTIQTNFTAGVLDPKLAGREDIVFWYNGLEDGNNLIALPQGGLTRRPGKQYLRELAKVLQEIDLTGATVTAPEGGTAADAIDGDDETELQTANDLDANDPFVVLKVDFAAPVAVAGVDIINYSLESGTTAGEFRWQYSDDDITYTDYAEPMDIDAEARSRRRREAAPVTAQYWQWVRIGDTNVAAKVSVGEIRFWEETDELSDGRLISFAYSTQEAYILAQTDQNIDVLTGADYTTSISAPHVSAQMSQLNYTQSLDTLLEFHRSRAPWKVFRQGGDTEFDFRYAAFENIPQYDYGVPPSVSAGVNEVQSLSGITTGLRFRLTLEGKQTNSVQADASTATTATRIQNALNGLSNTAGGITVAYSAPDYVVTFAGDDGLRPWEKMTCDKNDVTVTRTTPGEHAGSGAGDEMQTLNVAGTASGDKFTIEFEGHSTTTISVGAAASDTATNIQTALRALENVGGDTGLTVTDVTDGFEVTFSGDALGNRPHTVMKVFTLKGNGVWDVARTTRGFFPGEDIMSETRGWPRCGTFHQSRLIMGGFAGVPDGTVYSCVNERYNLDTERDDATKALLFRAEVEQVGTIYQIFTGQHLTFFTSDAEFFIPTEAIDENSVMKLGTRTGSKRGLRVHEVDGAILFVQGVLDRATNEEIGTSLHEFVFDELKQKYQSNILSKFSASLIKDPVDVALRKALSTDEADIYLMANADGSATSYTLLRADEVNAFMPMSTRDGDSILAVGVDKRQTVYWITERQIDGEARRYIEMWNEDLLLDCGTIVTPEAEEFTATAAQDEYTWTFTNPGSADAIGVRLNGGRLAALDYEVDLGSKTVTLSPAVAATVEEGDTVRVASMIIEVTGADHLEGETVQTYIDGTEGDDFVVSGGAFTLPDYADTEIQYGFDFDVSGKLMPLRVPSAPTLIGKKARIVNAYLQLYETAALEIKVNGEDWQDVPLVRLDDETLDHSESELLFTGDVELKGLRGYAVGAPFEFRQPGPGKFTLLSIAREVSL